MMTPLRLVDELNLLVKDLSLNNFELKDGLTDHPVLRAAIVTANQHHYGLEIDLTGFPEKQPKMYVLKKLMKQDGTPMGLSSAMHCLGITDEKTRVCFANSWQPDTHLIELYFKGKLWLECYEAHLETGNTIDHYLKHEE